MFHIPNSFFIEKFLNTCFTEVQAGHLVIRLIKKVLFCYETDRFMVEDLR